MTTSETEQIPLRERITQIEGFLEIDPGNKHLLRQIVDLLLAAGDTSQAMAWSARAVACHPDDLGLRFGHASAALATGQTALARALLESMAALAASEPAIAYNLAFLDLLDGAYDAALARIRGTPGLEQAVPESNVLSARCMHHLGDVEGALTLTLRHLAARPRDTQAQGLAALLAFDAGRLQKARHWAEQTLQAAPDNLDALVVRGCLHLEDKAYADAARVFEGVLALADDTGRAWLGLALVRLQERQFEQAKAAFERGCACMPGHLGTRVALGWCLVMMNDYTGARGTFELALAQNRNFAETHGGLAVLDLFQGRRDDAVLATERALRLDPHCVAGQYAKAMLDGAVHDAPSLERFTSLTMGRLLPAIRQQSPATL